ncbi:MAG: PAS domain-containing protein [Armatimonadetes bacterium]|nr:PAS domain-containing protein [Armatimonadota bacterium]
MRETRTPVWLIVAPWAGAAVIAVSLVLMASSGLRLVATAGLALVGLGLSLALVGAAHLVGAANDAALKSNHASETLALEVQSHKDALDDLAEGLDVAIFLVDSKLKIEYANQTAVRLFGFDDPEGRTLLAVTMSPQIVHMVERVAASGEPAKDELTFEQPDEQTMSVVVWRESTELQRIFVSLYDITHLRRLERVRRDFVANVSHELRTPLTTIRAMAETLVDDPEDEELRQKYGTRIVTEVDRLTRVAEDLLTLSSLEAGQAVKSDVDLAEIARHVVTQVQPKAQKKNLEVSLTAPEALPLRANDNQMTQVLLNLIDNAINYTQEGGVQVMVSTEEDHAVIEVRDTGIGIALDHQPRIFERFYRVDRGRSRESGGTGLGLSIVRNIVEAHGGKVILTSQLGHGSTFRVTLPMN